MILPMRVVAPTMAFFIALALTPPGARAQVAATSVDRVAHIQGKITDSRGQPIGGAVITANASAETWTASGADGTFLMKLPPGSYDILARKGGYTPAELTLTVNASLEAKTIALAMREANLNSLSVGNATSNDGTALNNEASSRAVLSNDAISARTAPDLRDAALELAGVSLAHPNGSVPDTSFVVRGGTVETRVHIDGHAVSAGATGRWNATYASLGLFDSIELVKGAGISGADAGETAFGTINLITRDFTAVNHADVVLGADTYGGSYSTIAVSGNALANDRLSYVFNRNVYGDNGPNAGTRVANVVAEKNNTALLLDFVPLDSPLRLTSDLAKLRWRFNESTSLTLGYVGIHGNYAETGGAYGAYDGMRTIVASAPATSKSGVSANGLEYSSPSYPGAIGQTIPTYTFSERTYTETNQPLFEGELRTAIKNDTLLIRPYAGTIFNRLDGSQRSLGPDPGGGEAWSQVTTGPGCSVAAPCYQAISFLAAIQQQELDRLHGTTVTLIHPMGEGVLHLGYDYRSDETSFYSGNPSYAFDNTGPSILAYQPRIPTTLARNFDWSASATIPVTSRLKLAVGGYYTTWKLDYSILNSVFNVATNLVTRSSSTATRSYAHSDPHLGLTWRPNNDTTYRITAGSSITVPYANQVSGGDTYTNILTPVGVIGFPNPNLKPETTVAYDLGLDHRFGNGTIVVADLFDNTIHNVFVNDVYPWVPSQNGLPDTPLNQLLFASVTTPGNGALERHYGVELSLARQPASGFGYRVTTTLQRAFLDELPASFFGVPSALINGKQLDGSTSIPYARAYGEVGYRNPSGLGATFGADYTSSNNWTNGPAFTLFSSTLRYDMRGGRRLQLTVSNLFNMTNGSPYDVTTAGNGFATVTYGSAKAGAAPTFGSLTTPRYGFEPRTLRLQYEIHPNH